MTGVELAEQDRAEVGTGDKIRAGRLMYSIEHELASVGAG